MRRALLPLVLVTACKFSPPAGTADASDAPPDDGQDGMTDPGCLAKWQAGTATFLAPTKLTEVSTSTTVDVEPWISEDGLVMVFVREESAGAGEIMFVSRTATTEPFSSIRPTQLSNPTSDESKASLRSNYAFAVFASNLALPTFQGEVDLYSSTRLPADDPDGSWMAPSQVIFNAVNTTGRDQDPFLVGDGVRLYLSVDPTGGTKSFLATSEFMSGVYAAPVKLFTTDENDFDPVVTPDEQVIVFSSSRGGGEGGRDLYYATRDMRTDPFGAAIQVPILNTSDDEEDPALSPDGCTLYFVSDRDGSLDIFAAQMM